MEENRFETKQKKLQRKLNRQTGVSLFILFISNSKNPLDLTQVIKYIFEKSACQENYY